MSGCWTPAANSRQGDLEHWKFEVVDLDGKR